MPRRSPRSSDPVSVKKRAGDRETTHAVHRATGGTAIDAELRTTRSSNGMHEYRLTGTVKHCQQQRWRPYA
ncbi:MAG: hypothetical protein ACKOB6_05050, partial [Candidatus Kapaibacterium sp.]